MEEREVFSMGESDLLSTLSYQATMLPAVGASAEVTSLVEVTGQGQLQELNLFKHTPPMIRANRPAQRANKR